MSTNQSDEELKIKEESLIKLLNDYFFINLSTIDEFLYIPQKGFFTNFFPITKYISSSKENSSSTELDVKNHENDIKESEASSNLQENLTFTANYYDEINELFGEADYFDAE